MRITLHSVAYNKLANVMDFRSSGRTHISKHFEVQTKAISCRPPEGGVPINFQYVGGGVYATIGWTSNIESSVFETPKIVIYLWDSNAERYIY